MLNGCFQAHVLLDWLITYLMLPLGLMVLYGGFVKNVVGRLQFVKNPILQAVGSSAVSGINSIKWVDYATWLSQPEGARSMVLEAFPEGWLILSALMILTWRVAEHFVLRVGAWKLYKLLFVLTLKWKPLDPAYKPVRGVIRQQVKRDLLAAFIAMMLKNQAGCTSTRL